MPLIDYLYLYLNFMPDAHRQNWAGCYSLEVVKRNLTRGTPFFSFLSNFISIRESQWAIKQTPCSPRYLWLPASLRYKMRRLVCTKGHCWHSHLNVSAAHLNTTYIFLLLIIMRCQPFFFFFSQYLVVFKLTHLLLFLLPLHCLKL